jgi:hypothetical protein
MIDNLVAMNAMKLIIHHHKDFLWLRHQIVA